MPPGQPLQRTRRKRPAVDSNVSAHESYTMVLPQVNARHISLCCLLRCYNLRVSRPRSRAIALCGGTTDS